MNVSTPSTLHPIPCDTDHLITEVQKELLDCSFTHLPKHIAIIPDGNRRWSKSEKKPFHEGYLQGALTLMKTALAARELQIPVLTVFSFSTENWKRSPREQELLWELFISHLKLYQHTFIRSGIKVDTIGNTKALPLRLQETLQEVKTSTASCADLTLVLALNYGGRDELVRTFNKMLALHQEGRIEKIGEEEIAKQLDTHRWPDPDLLIRTGGEQRLSNFLLWQSSYSELYIDQDFWPDFSTANFRRALEAFQCRCRRHGGGEA